MSPTNIDALDSRLARIETQLDSVAESLTTLARVEERVAGILAQQASAANRLNRHSERLDSVEVAQARSRGSLVVAERVGWMVITAGVSTLFAAAKSGWL